jgi:hypothetical protein
VEWLKVKALSSSPSTLKKKRLKKLYKQNSISYKQSSVVESLPSLYRFCPALQKTKQSKQTNFCGNGPRAIKKKKKKKKHQVPVALHRILGFYPIVSQHEALRSSLAPKKIPLLPRVPKH